MSRRPAAIGLCQGMIGFNIPGFREDEFQSRIMYGSEKMLFEPFNVPFLIKLNFLQTPTNG